MNLQDQVSAHQEPSALLPVVREVLPGVAPTPPGRQFTSLYVLCDPRTTEVRYVGLTTRQLIRRYKYHLYEATHGNETYKARWIRSLIADGVFPVLKVMALVENNQGPLLEQQYIFALRRSGKRLTNITNGGEGSPGRKVSDELRKRYSEERKGKAPCKACLDAAAAVCRGRKLSSEHRAAMSRALRGKPHTPEHSAAIAAGLKGKKFSKERSAQMSKLRTGMKYGPMSAAHKAAIGAANRGKVRSQETRAAISATLKGRPLNLSPEQRARRSEAMRKRWTKWREEKETSRVLETEL